jgi:hypothetical protein
MFYLKNKVDFIPETRIVFLNNGEFLDLMCIDNNLQGFHKKIVPK